MLRNAISAKIMSTMISGLQFMKIEYAISVETVVGLLAFEKVDNRLHF